MPSQNFDPYNETSLDEPDFVLRDSLGLLAVQVLSAKYNLAEMPYDEMLRKLYEIVCDLQTAFDRKN